MKRLLLPLVCAATLTLNAQAQQREVNLTLLETSDVHGNYLPYNFINGTPGKGSLARISTFVNNLRKQQGHDAVVLLDNGDILQGQPTAYYYNFIDTTSVHLCAAILNYMGYDAATIGNHDIETGHAVYDRWVSQLNFDMLGANALKTGLQATYWKPYTLIERQGIRIAVMGMVTPGIPLWLPENLWSGMHFDDMVSTAKHYMPEMKAKADLVVGLFHSGVGKNKGTAPGAENASLEVARTVPGFDIVFCGHDHRTANRYLLNTAGDSVLVLNPAADAWTVAQANVKLTIDNGKVKAKTIKGQLCDVTQLEPDPKLMKHFDKAYQTVKAFTNEQIGTSSATMETLPAFFGPSAFIDFIHQMQLDISGAEVSFAAPLSFDARIEAGPIYVRDMFNLYRYENLLYVMKLSGQEIKDYLEYAYDGWVRQMKTPYDPMLRMKPDAAKLANAWQRLEYPSFNFDSAAGIRYTVNLTQPKGQRIHIECMADGSPFDLNKTYRCALNSYRGNGGGNMLTTGAGIAKDKLAERLVWSTEKDLRFYLLNRIRETKQINPAPLNQWRFIPEDWAEKARLREVPLLRP